MSTALATLTKQLATRLDMGDGTGLMETLKATAFKGQVSDAQLTALMIVANQYGLNPWTKEIYAFPDKNNGIVPVVGVDGWARIINEHPQFDGMTFVIPDDGSECTCTIFRKDRSHPIAVTEYFSECHRDNSIPWKSHPKRMLRHKAMIQCARLSFGYVGIYDADEAERIAESAEIDITPKTRPEPKKIEACTDEKFDGNKAAWQKIVASGRKTAPELIIFLEAKAPLTAAQKKEIGSWTKDTPPESPPATTESMNAFVAGLGDEYTPE